MDTLTPIEYDKNREFTAEQVAEAARQAIDNWDWDYVDDAECQIEALQCLVQDAHPIELKGHINIWDWPSEYAEATAANIAASR